MGRRAFRRNDVIDQQSRSQTAPIPAATRNVHLDNATSGATFTRTVQPSPGQDTYHLSRPVEHCAECPALAGVRNLGLDDPSPDRPVLHCNFGGALGVVFGDIGTSPITIQTAFNPNDPLPVPISTDNVYGVVSLIFWSVMIIVTLTYVTLVMRADNDGGGSIMALITLLRRYGGARGRRTARTLAALGLVGAALFFGESMDHPCDLARVR